jgi:hypothetical protein
MFRTRPVVATAVTHTATTSDQVLERLCDTDSWPSWAGVVRAEAHNDSGMTKDLASASALHLWFRSGRDIVEEVQFHGQTLRLSASNGYGVLRVEDTAEGSRLTWTSQMRVRGPRFVVQRALRRRLSESLERLGAITPS